MKTSVLDYALPPELIAQHPCEKRDESRLLVVERATGILRFDGFKHIAGYLAPGDCMAMNDTRVIRARLRARKTTGGHIEVFLLRETDPGTWIALVKPSNRAKPGTRVRIANRIDVTLGETLGDGSRKVYFETPDVLGLLEEMGEVPLPPYIRREHPEDADLTRYQTVYARVPGAVAAPTAGLHFTPETLQSLEQAGVHRVALTLHVGYGTFRPIVAESLEDHVVETEEYHFPESAATALNQTRAENRRVVAVGTTSARVLETCYRDNAYCPGEGYTDLYIHPPYVFKAVDALQTNFHLPRSSLLALVCAFAGVDLIMEAYRQAIKERFRFYSYGDAMLIL